MREKTERKRLAILRVLQEAGGALGSARIAERLAAAGHEVSERTVRLYLRGMDREGLTENLGRRGRRITEPGLEELGSARVFEKVGFLAAKIDQITYRMDFDLAKRRGTVVANASLMRPDQLERGASHFLRVFEAGFAMGTLMGLFGPGERVGSLAVPEGFIAVATVCSVTLNGVLLAHGIPTNSRFGGLLEVRNGKPFRFVQIITYEGTSLDPLEVFIRSGMTDYVGAVQTGDGRIGAGFREVPAGSRDTVCELAHRLEEVGLGGFMTIGWPGQPLLDVPVSEGRVGAVVIGGLNPAAILEELDIRIESRALAGLIPYDRLFPYREFEERFRDLTRRPARPTRLSKTE